MSLTWHTSRFAIDLQRPQVMGIVNATPDSFSDGGQHADTASALRHCEQLLREGADDEHKKAWGQYFTPEPLARFAAGRASLADLEAYLALRSARFVQSRSIS